MFNYKDKNIFVGIDVHKKTYSLTVVMDQEVIKKTTLEARPIKLACYLNKHFSGANIFSAYEAGFSGFSLHRYLVENGIHNIVVHAASIEIAARERVKTDRRDSQKIAIQLASGRLKSVHIPEIEREDKRLVSRYRETLAKEKSKKSNQIKSFLYRIGKMPYENESRITEKWINKMLSQEYSTEQYFCLFELCNQWKDLKERIKNVEKKFAEQAEQELDLETIYRSVPGIGPIAARVLANELGDMKQFQNEGRLFSYTGLTPREYSSGEHRRLGHISRQGKPILRKILVQSAWRAISTDKNLGEIYHNMHPRVGAKRAIVGIARRLVGRIRSCINNKEHYKINQERVQMTA